MFKVAWKEKAYKQLKKIRDSREREMVYDAVGTLVNLPECQSFDKP
jgi:mRNA-degrading endonuclease RelE of RelBE toxin-antitoxin system